jgi:hypothetical protein
VASGQAAIANALRVDPELAARPRALASALYEAARRAPVDLERFATAFFARLPDGAAALRGHRAEVLGRSLLYAGRRAWQLGARGAALRQLARAVRHDRRIAAILAQKAFRRGGSVVKRQAYRTLGVSSARRLEVWLRGAENVPPLAP